MSGHLSTYLTSLGYTVSLDPLVITSTNKSLVSLADDIQRYRQPPAAKARPPPPAVCKFTLSEPFTFVKSDMDKDRNKLLSTMVIRYGEYPTLSEAMMKEMYEFYDANFFYGLLSKQVGNRAVTYKISNKATKSAGSLRMGDPVRITLSQPIFRDVVGNVDNLSVNGLSVSNRMDAIMRVMEHELVHLALSSSDTDKHAVEGHGTLFKAIVKGLFGHTETTHQLISKIPSSVECLAKELLRVGDVVSYRSKAGDIVTGKVIKLNPVRAQLLLEGGVGCSVPYTMLFRAGDRPPAIVSEPHLSRHSLVLGQTIEYKARDGVITKGTVVKLNPSKVKVKIDTGAVYCVPYSLLIS